jgi:hypothetical protein
MRQLFEAPEVRPEAFFVEDSPEAHCGEQTKSDMPARTAAFRGTALAGGFI